jgi:hypothetical protein
MNKAQQLILKKIQTLESLANDERNPIFVLAMKVNSINSKGAQIELIPYFFADTDKEMDKKDKLLILNYLEEFSKKERKTL